MATPSLFDLSTTVDGAIQFSGERDIHGSLSPTFYEQAAIRLDARSKVPLETQLCAELIRVGNLYSRLGSKLARRIVRKIANET
jgi:vacuolar-type H+-ATPase subunit C/Vma6